MSGQKGVEETAETVGVKTVGGGQSKQLRVHRTAWRWAGDGGVGSREHRC